MDDKPADTDRVGRLMGRAVTVMMGVTAIVALLCLCTFLIYLTLGSIS